MWIIKMLHILFLAYVQYISSTFLLKSTDPPNKEFAKCT